MSEFKNNIEDNFKGSFIETNEESLLNPSSTHKNYLVNGDMHQTIRDGHQVVSASCQPSICDMFEIAVFADAKVILSHDIDVPHGQGLANSIKLYVSSATKILGSGDVSLFQQKIQGSDIQNLMWGTPEALTCTVSFWIKSSVTGQFTYYFLDGNHNSQSFVAPFNVQTPDKWQKVKIVVPGPVTGGSIDFPNCRSRAVYTGFSLGAGLNHQSTILNQWHRHPKDFAVTTSSSNNFVGIKDASIHITGWQIEAGNKATAFEPKHHKIHLAIAIPTLNRQQYLEKNISFIDKQILPEKIRLSICISNSASTDDTETYLSKLRDTRDDIFLFNEQTGWTGGNYGHLIMALPKNADWVWYMGDDDFLPDPKAVAKVCDVLEQNSNNEEFKFVHACQARRSRASGKIIQANVHNLCNRFGYVEILGWISSMVVQKDIFIEILEDIDQRVQKARDEPVLGQTHSAFFHSSFFFRHLHNKLGAFIDLPLVEPQDLKMTASTRERWHYENMGERYIYVVDDLHAIIDQGIKLSNQDETFFRYHRYNLWDRFILHQINVILAFGHGSHDERVQATMSRFIDNWAKIGKVTNFIKNPVTRKQIVNVIEMTVGLCNLYLETNFDKKVEELLVRQAELLSTQIYDFELLDKQ